MPRFGKKLLTQSKALLEEVGWIARGGRITHVRELISTWWFGVRDLAEQSGRNRAIQHEVTVEELHLFDGLPSTNRRRTRRGCDRGLFFILIGIRIRPKWVIWL